MEEQITPNPSFDWCSREGALALKAKIEAFWAERGGAVQVLLLNGGFLKSLRGSSIDLRSDLKNGLPVRKVSDPIPANEWEEEEL